MPSRSLYLDGQYLLKNPAWHVEESAWKAQGDSSHASAEPRFSVYVGEVGCRAGEMLAQLQQKLGGEATFWGYDVSSLAIELAKSRANEKLHFWLSDLSDVKGSYFELVLVLEETALEALRDTGCEILDWFYTPRANSVGPDATQRLLKLPRKLLFALHEDVAARVLGGYSLLVLAR